MNAARMRHMNPERADRQPLQGGFTLVEMLVVLTIISILLAVAAPSFKNFSDKRKLTTEGDSISSLAHYARDTAMADGEPYMIVFNLMEQTFWLAKASALEYGDLSMTMYIGAYGPEAEGMTPEEMIGMRAHGILGEMREMDASVSIDRVDVEREGAIVSGAIDYEYVQFNADGTAEPASVYLLNNQSQAVVVDVWLRASRIDVRLLSENEASELVGR